MSDQRFAIIDLGTNTCQLLIFQVIKGERKHLFRDRQFVKLGQESFKKKEIQDDAIERLLAALSSFKDTIEKYRVPSEQVRCIATSALRSSKNRKVVVRKVLETTGIKVEVINGEQEAEYIYQGAKQAINLPSDYNVLIVDIGGGSVEFVIANNRKILWKQSLEIGAQRLLDRFVRQDPMIDVDIQRLEIFLEAELLTLSERVFTYAPHAIIGCSGTFETLAEIAAHRTNPEALNKEGKLEAQQFDYDLEDFHHIYQAIVRQKQAERLQIPGMLPERVEMIVPATCLVKFLLERYDLEQMVYSAFALKEGVIAELLA